MGKQELQVYFCFYKQKTCGVRSMSDYTGKAPGVPYTEDIRLGMLVGLVLRFCNQYWR